MIKIEISAKDVKPHGYVFFAKAHAVTTAINGLGPDRKKPALNHYDVTVKNHLGYVTAGHAMTMLMKKCKRMNMRFNKDTQIGWKQDSGEPSLTVEHIWKDDGINTDRMNSIIKTLASNFKLQAVLPYEEG